MDHRDLGSLDGYCAIMAHLVNLDVFQIEYLAGCNQYMSVLWPVMSVS